MSIPTPSIVVNPQRQQYIDTINYTYKGSVGGVRAGWSDWGLALTDHTNVLITSTCGQKTKMYHGNMHYYLVV